MKGQAAIEFLMTYGWALLIMMAVIGVLFYVGVFNQQPPSTCIAQGGFTCSDWQVAPGGAMSITLIQSTGHDMLVTNVSCSDQTVWAYADANISLYSGVPTQITATCYNSDGSTPSINEFYQGRVRMLYTDLQTNFNHSMYVELTSPVNP